MSQSKDLEPTKLGVDVSYTPSPHSFANKFMRVCWYFTYLLLFRMSPKQASGWRRLILQIFGAEMGLNSKVAASVKIWAPWNLKMGAYSSIAHSVDCYCQGPITIGSHTTISQYSYLCSATHDYTKPNLPLVVKSVHIGSGVWICADVFVGPDVTIGDGVVVGARSSVFADLPEWTVCVGNPAKPVGARVMDLNFDA